MPDVYTNIGTKDALRAGWKADAVVAKEPTNLEIMSRRRDFVWFEVNTHGVAYHGSRADKGVDAISKAGYSLTELNHYADRLATSHKSGYKGSHSVQLRPSREIKISPITWPSVLSLLSDEPCRGRRL
ncbi:hypothetical protein EDB80DRAFT_222675 [Ilyonectria destructans]|nr:hypothetical protein EDB80DRAFT_222675 [Ilyonectria destructans]